LILKGVLFISGKMYNEITNLQTRVFIFCKSWAEIEKTPVPQKEIVNQMETQGVSTSSCINAINSLLTKGFIRKAYHLKQSRTYYVLLRNI